MENTSLSNDVSNIKSSSEDDSLAMFSIRDRALKVIYTIIGSLGVVDNLFVIIIFIFFMKITEKVSTTGAVLDRIFIFVVSNPSIYGRC